MKGKNGKMKFSSGSLRRCSLLIALAVLFSSLPAFASGAHEAITTYNDVEYRGREVFTYNEDGELPFLDAHEFYAPKLEPDYVEPPKPILTDLGSRNGGTIVLTYKDLTGKDAKEPEGTGSIVMTAPVEEDPWGADSDIWGDDDDLWGDEEDLWGEEDDLWGEDDDLWGEEDDIWGDDEDLWGEDDPWGDDFWEEEWEPVPAETTRDALNEDDEDFWSDFFIAGEEVDMDLPDGSYFMDLYVNDQYKGNVEIVAENGSRGIDAEAFRYITSDVLTKEEKDWVSSFRDTVPFADLEARGYKIKVDSIEYVTSITIPTSALDTVVLSIATGGVRGGSGIFGSHPLANAIEVDNTVFNLETNYSLSMYVPVYPEFDPWDLLAFDLSVSNRLRLFDVFNQFSFGMSVSRDSFFFRFGLYSFYTDFPKAGLRLSWGNISGYGSSVKGTPLGIKLERNAAFYDSSWQRKSYVAKEIVLETRSEVIVTTDGKENFRSTLEMGTYRLEDFVLSSGGNDVQITIKPLDGSPVKSIDFSVLYGYSLLAPGENWWGVSLMTGREMKGSKAVSPFAFSLPYKDNVYLEYDVRNFSLGFFFDVGIFRGLTMRSRGSFTNNPTDTVDWSPSFRFDATFLHTNDIGNMSFSTAYWNSSKDGKIFGHNANASLSMSFGTGISQISSFSFSFGYDYNNSVLLGIDKHSGRGSFSTGGRLGFLNWSTGLSGFMDFQRVEDYSYAANFSISFAAGRHVSVSSSFSFSQTANRDPMMSLRVGLSMNFGPVSTSVSGDDKGNLDTRISGGYGRHSASGSISTNWNDDWNVSMSGFYSFFGDYLSVSSGFSTGIDWLDNKGRFAPRAASSGISLNLSTSSLFADGFFQMRSTIPYNYLMVKQKGALRGNILTTASGNSSSEDGLFQQFGIGSVDGVGGYRDEYLTLYSQSKDGQSYYTYNVKIPASKRNGYLLVLNEDYRYTASGLVPGWLNASSPIYKVENVTDGNGNEIIELRGTDEFIFSDETTRFLTPALLPGRYAFDVPVGDGTFMLVMFDIPELDKPGVIIFGDLNDIDTLFVSDAYSVYKVFEFSTVMTTDEYWEMLYPPEEDEFYFGDNFDDEFFSEDDLWGSDDDLWGDDDLWEDDSSWSDTESPYTEDDLWDVPFDSGMTDGEFVAEETAPEGVPEADEAEPLPGTEEIPAPEASESAAENSADESIAEEVPAPEGSTADEPMAEEETV